MQEHRKFHYITWSSADLDGIWKDSGQTEVACSSKVKAWVLLLWGTNVSVSFIEHRFMLLLASKHSFPLARARVYMMPICNACLVTNSKDNKQRISSILLQGEQGRTRLPSDCPWMLEGIMGGVNEGANLVSCECSSNTLPVQSRGLPTSSTHSHALWSLTWDCKLLYWVAKPCNPWLYKGKANW